MGAFKKKIKDTIFNLRCGLYELKYSMGYFILRETLPMAREVEKEFIDYYISIDSMDVETRNKVDRFMSNYAGHDGDSLEKLFNEYKLTDNQREIVEPFMESSKKCNELFHITMDIPEKYAIKIGKERIRVCDEYLEFNKSKLLDFSYERVKSGNELKKKELEEFEREYNELLSCTEEELDQKFKEEFEAGLKRHSEARATLYSD